LGKELSIGFLSDPYPDIEMQK